MKQKLVRYWVAIVLFTVAGILSNVMSLVSPVSTVELHWLMFTFMDLIYVTLWKTLSVQLKGMERIKKAPKALTSVYQTPPSCLGPAADANSHEEYAFDAVISFGRGTGEEKMDGEIELQSFS